MDTLRNDVVFALRWLTRGPGLTLAAVVCLALCIGATTTMYSALRAIVLYPELAGRRRGRWRFEQHRVQRSGGVVGDGVLKSTGVIAAAASLALAFGSSTKVLGAESIGGVGVRISSGEIELPASPSTLTPR